MRKYAFIQRIQVHCIDFIMVEEEHLFFSPERRGQLVSAAEQGDNTETTSCLQTQFISRNSG